MKKIIGVILIVFVMLTVSAEQMTKTLEVEEFKYKPYKASEFIFESLALLGGAGITFGLSFGLSATEDDFDQAALVAISTGMALSPIIESVGPWLVGNLGYKSDGNIFAGMAGGYAMALPFFLFFLTGDDDIQSTSLILAINMIAPGVMIGYNASKKTKLFSSGALITNTLGTIFGGIAGMSTHFATRDSDLDSHSIVHAIPSIFLTLAGTTVAFAISRYAIADDPDNAGTWLGVLGGAAAGALTGFAVGTIWEFSDNGQYDRGVTTALVIGGAILGQLVGFAATHTTMPERKINPKEKKVAVNILPPMMVPERIPLSNKTFKRWMILNAGISF